MGKLIILFVLLSCSASLYACGGGGGDSDGVNSVAITPAVTGAQYVVFAWNDLGMHCQDLDQRVASILPPFNVLHAQVVKKGHVPVILDGAQAEVVYSAASNPQDPALANPVPAAIFTPASSSVFKFRSATS